MENEIKKRSIILRHFLPDWKKRGCTVNQAKFAAYYMATNRDSKAAYRLTFNLDAGTKIEAPGEHYYKMLMYCGDPKVKELCLVIGDRIFAKKKEELTQELLEILYTQATYDPADIVDIKGEPVQRLNEMPLALRRCIKDIEVDWKKGNTVRLVDRMQAVKILSEYTGLLSPMKNELNITISPKEEQELAKAFSEAMESKDER